MKTYLKLASLAALTTAIVALPAAATSMGAAPATCHPASSMTKCGAKCAGKCASKQHHTMKKHHPMQAKCGAKKRAAKCAPKCAAKH